MVPDHLARRRFALPAVIVSAALLAGCSATPAAPSSAPAASVALSSIAASTDPLLVPSVAPTVAATPSEEPTPAISADPLAADSHVTIQLAAIGNHWSATQLEAPAGKVWHIEFANQSTTLHNFALQKGSAVLFKTETFSTGTHAVDVPGLPADTYLFVCTVHPQTMRGGVVIK